MSGDRARRRPKAMLASDVFRMIRCAMDRSARVASSACAGTPNETANGSWVLIIRPKATGPQYRVTIQPEPRT